MAGDGALLRSTSDRERVGRDSMLIRISDPDLLVDFCDYLSPERFAFSAVQPVAGWGHRQLRGRVG